MCGLFLIGLTRDKTRAAGLVVRAEELNKGEVHIHNETGCPSNNPRSYAKLPSPRSERARSFRAPRSPRARSIFLSCDHDEIVETGEDINQFGQNNSFLFMFRVPKRIQQSI